MRHRRHSYTRLARDWQALAFAAPQVVAHRLSRQLGSDELHRMSAEKVAAFYESWSAMWLELYRANLHLAMSMWWLPSSRARLARHGRRTAAAVLGAGLVPVRRRAVANARRLARQR